jgi:RHS repeat-associated protein
MVAIAEMLTAEDKVERPFARAGGNNIPNGTTDSCWFGWQTMEERNPYGGSGSTDTPTKQYVWGTYIDECLQLNLLAVAGPQQLAIGVYYPLQDTLYRTMALANSSGAVVEAYDTDAYGNTIIFTGPGADKTWFTDDDTQSSYGANDIIYCGYRYDAETENYYVRNRYYSPTLGRWLTRDPIGYRGGINLYGYVNSSPVGNVDAEGLRDAPQFYPPYSWIQPSGPAPGSYAWVQQQLRQGARQFKQEMQRLQWEAKHPFSPYPAGAGYGPYGWPQPQTRKPAGCSSGISNPYPPLLPFTPFRLTGKQGQQGPGNIPLDQFRTANIGAQHPYPYSLEIPSTSGLNLTGNVSGVGSNPPGGQIGVGLNVVVPVGPGSFFGQGGFIGSFSGSGGFTPNGQVFVGYYVTF